MFCPSLLPCSPASCHKFAKSKSPGWLVLKDIWVKYPYRRFLGAFHFYSFKTVDLASLSWFFLLHCINFPYKSWSLFLNCGQYCKILYLKNNNRNLSWTLAIDAFYIKSPAKSTILKLQKWHAPNYPSLASGESV